MNSLLFRNATLVNPGCEPLVTSVLVRDGRIASLEEGAADEVIDAEGLLLFPGLIDAHVHFRDPGYTDKEDILTGAAAAAHGGFTSVIMMGNTSPPMDDPDVIREALDRGRQTGIRVHSCGNVTRGMLGRELTDFTALRQAGAVLLTDDGLPVRDEGVMRRACEEAAKAGMVLSLHEEDPQYVTQAGVNNGEVAWELGFECGADRRAEITMVERDIRLARETGAQITVQHISARESVELIREARAEGVLIHTEGTPHHFSLTEDAVRTAGTNARINPPLREEADRQAVIEGLADGTIDMIATDHAPHTAAEKARDFAHAPSGIVGLETALSLVQRELVTPGYLTWPRAVERMTAAYTVYGLPGGRVETGAAADLVLYDPSGCWTVSEQTLRSKSRNTPFLHETLPGVVKMTVCGGRIVWRDAPVSEEN